MNNSISETHLISIIIVNYNGLNYTQQCIESLFRFHSAEAFEVIVVDNNSTDGSVELLEKQFPDVTVCKLGSNKGFGSANNYGVKQSHGDYLFILNNDTIIESNIFPEMVSMLKEDQTIGVIAPQLKNPDGSIQLSYGKFPSLKNEYTTRKQQAGSRNFNPLSDSTSGQIDWVTAAAMFVRRDAFEKAGGFDEQYFMYFEDIDLCKRIGDLGYKILYYPKTSLIHIGGGSKSNSVNGKIQIEYRKSQLLYYVKHQTLLQQFLLKAYLFIKYGVQTLVKKNEDSRAAKEIVRLIFR
ncbi:MAG: glycosyltransferase family 2 protein [Bacteroidota bacterium]|nr:glycosyltransferase family 2 protein [Bacteroidota bacterium]